MSAEKELPRERIEELHRLARHLVEHPGDIPEAERRGDLAELLGMAVALGELFLTPSFTLADLLPQGHEALERDPQLHAMMLDYLCQRYEAGEITLTPVLLPMLARHFRLWFAHATAQGQAEGKEHGTQRASRMVDIKVQLGRLPVAQAAAEVAAMTGRDPKSLEVQYYAYLRKNFDEK